MAWLSTADYDRAWLVDSAISTVNAFRRFRCDADSLSHVAREYSCLPVVKFINGCSFFDPLFCRSLLP